MLLPTCPDPAAERPRNLLDDEAAYTRANLLALRNTRVGSLLGLTGLSLPTGTPHRRGLSAAGRGPHAEGALLRLGGRGDASLGLKATGSPPNPRIPPRKSGRGHIHRDRVVPKPGGTTPARGSR